MALVVAGERGHGPVAVLELVVGGAEPGPAPARLEQGQQPIEASGAVAIGRAVGPVRARRLGLELLGVKALQHLVDQDPEPLVDRRLLRDREHPRELVLERTGPVEVDVRRRERQAVAASRDELLQRRLAPRGDQIAASREVALLADHVLVERRRLERGALLRRGDPADQLVDRRQRLGGRLGIGPLDQGRELEQLQVARHRLGDVLGGVEAHLRERRARAPRRLEDLVAEHPIGRVKALGGAEQLLLVELLLAAEHPADRLVEDRGGDRLLPDGLRPGEDHGRDARGSAPGRPGAPAPRAGQHRRLPHGSRRGAPSGIALASRSRAVIAPRSRPRR